MLKTGVMRMLSMETDLVLPMRQDSSFSAKWITHHGREENSGMIIRLISFITWTKFGNQV